METCTEIQSLREDYIFTTYSEINTETKNIPLSEKPDIDWNFVLGLLFGIGYLIFAANA